MRLFAERAAAALRTFGLTEANAPVVAAICRRLDGIPLAIELAAARVRILAPEQIAARLDERFRLLTGGSAEALPRQQTLRAALDWSHDLLAVPERTLLRRLAVFAGGCDVEAVEAVCTGDGLEADEVVDLLTHLADKSLVVVEHDGQTARYRLLESVRAYALARLDAAGEQAEVQARHAAHYLAMANAADAAFMGQRQPASLARLNRDVDNLRAALTFARETEQPDLAGEFAIRLWRFWYLTGRATEGRARLAEIIAATPPEPAEPRARLLDATATLAHSQGDYSGARRALEQSLAVWRPAHNIAGIAGAAGTLALVCKAEGDLEGATALLEEALDLWREMGHEARVAVTLNNLSAVAIDRGTYAEAERYQEESLAIKRRAGDQHGIATSLHNLAECARYQGDLRHAVELLEESIALSRSLAIRQQTAQSLHSLGIVAYHLGDPARAAALLGEGLALYQSLDLPQGIALCLEGFAEMAAASDAERSVRLYGAAGALREAIGAALPPADAAVRERDLTACRAALGDAAFAAAWVRGRALTVEQAVDAGLGAPAP